MSHSSLSLKEQQVCRESLEHEQRESLRTTNNWAHVDREKTHAGWDALYHRIAAAIKSQASPEEPHVQEMLAEHYQIICSFYTPSKQAYLGMSLSYCEDEYFQKHHQQYGPNFGEFLAAAMRVFAANNFK